MSDESLELMEMRKNVIREDREITEGRFLARPRIDPSSRQTSTSPAERLKRAIEELMSVGERRESLTYITNAHRHAFEIMRQQGLIPEKIDWEPTEFLRLLFELGEPRIQDLFRPLGRALWLQEMPGSNLQFEYIRRLEQVGILHSTETSRIIESYLGSVDDVEDGIAFVTLKDSKERISHATCPFSNLAQHGIKEGGRFRCEVHKSSGGFNFVWAALPHKELTQEYWSSLLNKADKALGKQTE